MKVQIEGFIHFKKEVWDEGKFHFFQCDMKDHGYSVVLPHVIEVEIDDGFDPRQEQVDALKAQRQKAMADFQALVTSIDRQIGELTALECAT